MKHNRVFSTKEEAEKYFYYLTIIYREDRKEYEILNTFRTKKQAESSEEYTHSHNVRIVTRKQFKKLQIESN